MVSGSVYRRVIFALLALVTGIAAETAAAQSIAWPSFGPARGLLRLDGLTDTLPDFIGPLDGSADLTIFTEGNHYPVLLPLVLDAFPSWCRSTGVCHADPGKILVVTLPQPMIVNMLTHGGIALGNAVLPVGPDQHVFPDLVMAGPVPLRQLAQAGVIDREAVVFARHRGLGLLMKKELAGVGGLPEFREQVRRIVLASPSEPGARNQYRATLESVLGAAGASDVLAREVVTFPGRLGIQHRDVPYAVLNDVADGGIVFSHLAAFYAQIYPDRLRSVAVPAAEPFGQELAMARTARRAGPLTAAFEHFLLATARQAYPDGGFAEATTFPYGVTLDLMRP
jgi:hypothetical protein